MSHYSIALLGQHLTFQQRKCSGQNKTAFEILNQIWTEPSDDQETWLQGNQLHKSFQDLCIVIVVCLPGWSTFWSVSFVVILVKIVSLFFFFFFQSVMNKLHTVSVPYAVMKTCPLSWAQRVHTHKGSVHIELHDWLISSIFSTCKNEWGRWYLRTLKGILILFQFSFRQMLGDGDGMGLTIGVELWS